MYKVIYKFADLRDSKYVYNVGDIYPREGSKPTQERINALLSGANKIGKPLIEKVASEKPVKNKEILNEPEAVEPIQEEKPKSKRGRKKKTDAE